MVHYSKQEKQDHMDMDKVICHFVLDLSMIVMAKTQAAEGNLKDKCHAAKG